MQGHTKIVGDIAFQPGSAVELVSVGDDSAIMFWDTRSGTQPVLKVEDAHQGQEIGCTDWSSQDLNMVATGLGLFCCCILAKVFPPNFLLFSQGIGLASSQVC